MRCVSGLVDSSTRLGLTMTQPLSIPCQHLLSSAAYQFIGDLPSGRLCCCQSTPPVAAFVWSLSASMIPQERLSKILQFYANYKTAEGKPAACFWPATKGATAPVCKVPGDADPADYFHHTGHTVEVSSISHVSCELYYICTVTLHNHCANTVCFKAAGCDMCCWCTQ